MQLKTGVFPPIDRFLQLHLALIIPPSMRFSRQEYWSGLPFPSPGDLPYPGIEPRSPAFQADALTSEPPGKPSPFFQFSSVQSLSRVWLFATPWILSLVDIKSFCICGCAFFFLNVLSFCFLGLKSKTVPDSSLFYAQCLAHNRNSINTCHKTVYYSLSSSGMMSFIFFRFLHSLSYSLVPSSKFCEWEVLSAA